MRPFGFYWTRGRKSGEMAVMFWGPPPFNHNTPCWWGIGDEVGSLDDRNFEVIGERLTPPEVK